MVKINKVVYYHTLLSILYHNQNELFFFYIRIYIRNWTITIINKNNEKYQSDNR